MPQDLSIYWVRFQTNNERNLGVLDPVFQVQKFKDQFGQEIYTAADQLIHFTFNGAEEFRNEEALKKIKNARMILAKNNIDPDELLSSRNRAEIQGL